MSSGDIFFLLYCKMVIPINMYFMYITLMASIYNNLYWVVTYIFRYEVSLYLGFFGDSLPNELFVSNKLMSSLHKSNIVFVQHQLFEANVKIKLCSFYQNLFSPPLTSYLWTVMTLLIWKLPCSIRVYILQKILY